MCQFSISAGGEWLPFENEKNVEAGSALDFSSFRPHAGPAGSLGWVRVKNGHFVFEKAPDAPCRFVGVNLCNEANYPDRALADELVTRFSRLGYNSIRVHHHDRRLFRRGKDGQVSFDEENARKLDYFLARAYEAGLYVTTDLFVSRAVQAKDVGLPGEGKLSGHIYKCLQGVYDPVFEDWKAHAALFLNRVNTVTGRRYAEEPGLPFLSLVNEGNLLWCWTGIRRLEPMKRAWRNWIRAKRAQDPNFAPGISEDCEQVAKTGDDPDFEIGAAKNDKNAAGAAMVRFAADLEARAALRQIAFVRSLGARQLLTSLNGGMGYVPMLKTREGCFDWVDTHAYVDHPRHFKKAGQYPIGLPNENLVKAEAKMPGVAFSRVAGKPFSVSEWNFAGPGAYRGVGGLMMGALAAGQGWDALWRFAYSHGGGLEDRQGAPKAFDLAVDPLNQASDRAVLALFLRGDLKPFANAVVLDCSQEPDFPSNGRATLLKTAWHAAAWNLRIAVTSRPRAGAVAFGACAASDKPPRPGTDRQVCVDRQRGIMTVTTARTVGGFATAGAFAAGPAAMDVGDVPASAWLTALDARPIPESRRLLLVHLTDVQGSGALYEDATRRKMLRPGEYPPLMRRGTLAVRLRLRQPDGYAVWALTTSGRRVARVPCEVRADGLTFRTDIRQPDGSVCFHFEICKESKQQPR